MASFLFFARHAAVPDAVYTLRRQSSVRRWLVGSSFSRSFLLLRAQVRSRLAWYLVATCRRSQPTASDTSCLL